MMPSSPPSLPIIRPVEPGNIPELLRREKRWVGWWTGPIKPSGKFDKYPVDPVTGHKVNPLDPANWLSFDDAMDACRRDMAKGVGIVLSDQHPIRAEGSPLYLTAIDLDECMEHQVEQGLWEDLGQPYLEVSPSLRGLRMFGLCSTPIKGGMAGNGRELYSSGRFMTVTGLGSRGTLRNISAGLIALEQRWFPASTAPSKGLPAQPLFVTRPETRENVALVISMLQNVSSSKATYEVWRDLIWAIASTGWSIAPKLAHHWSALDPNRYDMAAVDKLLTTFDPSRGITLGTLDHHARLHGWTGNVSQLAAQVPPPPPLAPPPPPTPAAPLGPLLTAAELRQLPSVPYVVRGLLPAQGLAAIYGEPSSGKSFLALDLAHAIANGRETWFGFPVRQAPVAYVALEGQGGLRKRVDALEQHSGQLCTDALQFWRPGLHLLTDTSVRFLGEQVVSKIGKGAVVFIDTLNQASPGADENTSKDMGTIIDSAKRIAATVEGLVVLIHHAGKNRALGPRGHSSLFAALDVVIEVTGKSGPRRWEIAKAKDDSGSIVRDFELVPYEVGQDPYGPETSCAVRQTAHAGPAKKAPVLGKNQKVALAELQRLLKVPGQTVEYKFAVQQVTAALSATSQRAGERAKETMESLIGGGHLLLGDGGLRLAD